MPDIEVNSSHIGMGWNRDALAKVTDYNGQTTPSGQARQLAVAPADTPSPSPEHTMPNMHTPNPTYPDNVPEIPHIPDEFVPGSPPLEPDVGPLPAPAPGEPWPDHVIEPTSQFVELALCP